MQKKNDEKWHVSPACVLNKSAGFSTVQYIPLRLDVSGYTIHVRKKMYIFRRTALEIRSLGSLLRRTYWLIVEVALSLPILWSIILGGGRLKPL